MEDYKQHVESANFIIKLIEFIVGIFGGIAFTIVIFICYFNGLWKSLWPALLIIPGSTLLVIMLIELFRHIFMSFALKTDYYQPYSPTKGGEQSEERYVTVTDPNANNQNNNK